jgi:hypothetical protein
MANGSKTRVFVSAFFCDRVLREQDEVLSAIRVADLFVAPVPESGAHRFVPRLETNLVVIFRSDAPVEFVAGIKSVDPRGTANATTMPIVMTGEPGLYVFTAVIEIFINGVLEGTHWYDISVDGALANRVPLRVKYVPVPTSAELRQTWGGTDEGTHR